MTSIYGLTDKRRPELVPDFVGAIPRCEDGALAIFDADGTLWVDDVADDFTTWMIDQGLVPGENWTNYMRIYRDDHPVGCRYLLSFYEGMTLEELGGHVYTWWRDHAHRGWVDEVVEVVRHLHDKGYPIWVVSGTPTEFLLLRSQDGGHTWTDPRPIEPPLVGPCFELCCPVTPLADGRWLLPTSTWRSWDGECPNGMKMISFVSADQGRSWPEYIDVLADPEGGVIYWESKILELADGRLLAAAWAYDEAASADRPNQYALSADGGRTWSAPRSTGLTGQTLTPLVLEDGRVLCAYRRMDETGLWANLSHIEGDEWVNEACEPLWGARASDLTGASESMAENFQVLRFGAPCLTQLADGAVLAAFWCYEDCVSNIRWFELRIA